MTEDRQVALAAANVAKQLEQNPYLGDKLREKSNQKPLAECRKVKFDRADRPSSAKPRYRYRFVYRIEPHDGAPETVVVMAVGTKPSVYGNATSRVAGRMREQAARRVTRARTERP
ncbi:MAG: hypothetical protein ABSG43_18475 [Solirubrobacteraceae bacterium]